MYSEYEQMLIEKTYITIKRYVEQNENAALSFSGGKDSTVLYHIIYKILELDIPCIFCNTGVEFESIVDFVKTKANVTIIKPKIPFVQIIRKYGYPVVSKEQSCYIDNLFSDKVNEKTKQRRLAYGSFSISKKWRFLLDQDKFKISDRCCYHLKKHPLRSLKYKYITGERASESSLRKKQLHSCVLKIKCVPLRLWNDELIDKYIEAENIEICSIYKSLKRTGCKFCLYGIQYDGDPDRIDKLKYLEPKSYEFAKAMNIINIKEFIKSGGDTKWLSGMK